MNRHTFDVLEYHTFLDFLAGYAVAEATREALRALRPAPAADARTLHNALYADTIRLREMGTVELPRRSFLSPAELLRRVAPEDAVLRAEDFAALRRLLEVAAVTRRVLGRADCRDYPALRAIAGRLNDFADLSAAIDRVFDPDWEVRDDASAELRRLRREITRRENRIRERLNRLVHDIAPDGVLQDQYVAVRGSRYVIPVRREAKGRLPGIVHDQSNSGRTLFIEPQAIVDDGNALAQMRLDARDEVRRILAQLSVGVRRAADDIRGAFAALVDYDRACAVSAWAVEYNCNFPGFGRTLDLRQARHPLLHAQLRRDGREQALMPLDLQLAPRVRVLAITGSNAGGKTVALKTVGLLCLLAQTGLPIPAAPGASVCSFSRILADIGDEQSLAQNLSTFSGHMRQVVGILGQAAERHSLVLLDELGAGTDPDEGGALGCAILACLARTSGVTVATTHLGMIKNFVAEHADMENAAVQFNHRTLEPQYCLRVGRPGASNAIAIARRLGLPKPLLAEAEALVHGDQLRLDRLLVTMESDQGRLADELQAARTAHQEATELREALHKERESLRADRRRLLHDARREAAGIVDNTRREMNRLAQQTPGESPEKLKERRRSLERKRERLRQGVRDTAPRRPPRHKQNAPPLTPGCRVWVEPLQGHGKLVELSADGRRAVVELNGIRIEAKPGDLSVAAAEASPGDAAPQTATREVRRPAATGPTALELNLIGRRVDDALIDLERFIDRLLLVGVDQGRIVHGFGTGQLRRAIHEYLRSAPGIRAFRLGRPEADPGGAGVTWLELE